MPSVEVTSNQVYINVPMQLYGNVGVGTTNPMYPLHVIAPRETTVSFSSLSYEDFTLGSAYANRTNMSIIGNADDGAALIPDFEFDFYINNKNYRESTYVGTNGYITFGKQFNYANDPIASFTVPSLFIGYTDLAVNTISYYIGNYLNTSAVYIFFDGYDVFAPSRLNQWCAIIQSNGNIRLLIKSIHHNSSCLFGLTDGNSSWLVELPQNNSIPNPAITNVGYELTLIHTPKGVGMNVKGDVIATGKLHVTDAMQVSSIGLTPLLRYPPSAMSSNSVDFRYELYGNGNYVASSSTEGYVDDPYKLFERKENSTFLQWGYGNDSLYFGSTSTTFIDTNNISDSILGEWVQLQLPSPIALHSYGIKPVENYLTSAPRLYVVLGSMDASTWHMVDDHRASPVVYANTSEKILNVPFSSSTYSYYRFVTNAIGIGGNDPHVRMHELTFYVKNMLMIQGDLTTTCNVIVHGNIGIGTLSPSVNLDVVGTIKATQFIGDGSLLSGISGGGGGPNGWTSANGNVYTTSANVGIGTTTPLAKTHIYYNGVGDILRIDDINSLNFNPLIINSNGNVGIGTNDPLTYKLAVNGTLYAAEMTGFGMLSDARYKEDVNELPNSLSHIRALRPVDFRWKNDVYFEPRKGTFDVGFIAQEIEAVIPLVIRKFTPPGVTEELKGVAYEKLTPYIVKAIQELDNEYRTEYLKLRQELDELKAQMHQHLAS
jgi:hypothetical protein